MKKIRDFFSPGEDKTDLNLLLRQLLNEKSIEESLKLKKELDEEYSRIMKEDFETKSTEIGLIKNYLKQSNGTKN